jgi:type I restriction enzyme, R subunit
VSSTPSSNFSFLAVHDPQLSRLGREAEQFFSRHPDVSLLRLRQLGERLAQRTAALSGVYFLVNDSQIDLLRRLEDRRVVPPEAAKLFHGLRRAGNEAAHEATGSHRQALLHLRLAWTLGVWFQRTFADPRFHPGPFLPPPDPEVGEGTQTRKIEALLGQLGEMRRELAAQREAAAAALTAAGEAEQRRAAAEEKARREAEDHAAALDLAEETEQAKLALAAELARLQAQAQTAPPEALATLIFRARTAGERISLDEAATRELIDEQLRVGGWEADTRLLTHASGTRPQKGRNLAIAEWPTASGPADYVLFVGLTPMAVVEAKREDRNIPGSISQAKRYSRGFLEEAALGGPWAAYRVPFLFATNGRPYLRQIESESGVWFLDARRPQNHPRALTDWYTPTGLTALLKQDLDGAEESLRAERPEDLPYLYPFQAEAVRRVEAALEKGERKMLVAMATGTGKTRTAIALVYRLLKAHRFNRILFLVDRSALGEQTADKLGELRMDSFLTLPQIFDVKELQDDLEADTRLKISTIQSMAHRLLGDNDAARPKIDDYDCLIVDECHRGYLLDREMGDAELSFRDQADYISAYRRVLDHFDAVKIGLTATPAVHTVDIFGAPVVRYTYRQAVIDGYLVDHEPPYQIHTRLAIDGMIWRAGEDMQLYDPATHQIDTMTLPDEVKLEVDSFNRVVITREFNRAVSEELAKYIDPALREKTIVYCVDDAHADIVVDELKKAFDRQSGGIDDDAVQKITGKADKPLQKIREFKNEPFPRVAVTVDLLTTGIDVPEVANLVFLRRVKSRILYEQMLGRATRLCDELHKESFRIFDAVNLYQAMQTVTEMKPVAVDPHIPFADLLSSLAEAQAAEPVREDALRHHLDELLARLQRKRKAFQGTNGEAMRQRYGVTPTELIAKLRQEPLAMAVDWLLRNRGLGDFLDQLTGERRRKVISFHSDEIHEVTRGYGKGIEQPGDYLDAFTAFVQNNLRNFPVLLAVAQKPRDLTRAQLRAIKGILDAAGYSETALRSAWREKTNVDIAASILGHIRQAALGDPLVPYGERVNRALRKILASQPWSAVQRRWLERIAHPIKMEQVADPALLEEGIFKEDGGFKRLNKIFEGRLPEILADFQEEIWRKAV